MAAPQAAAAPPAAVQQSAAMTLLPLTAAAVSTAAIMYPVDVMRAITMANAGAGKDGFSIGQFYQKYGLKGFASQGVIPEIAKSSVMRVSKFFFYPIVCEGLWNKKPSKSSALEKGIAGAIATMPEIAMISPLEVAKIGLQTDRENKFKNNSTAFARHIFQTRGISGLYSGWAGMQWRQSWWTGMYFATLSFWKGIIEPPIRDIGAPQAIADLVSGFVAGFVATFPNTPGDVVRSVVQKKLFSDPTRPAYGISPYGIMEHVTVTREILQARGIAGLYAGIGFKALHLGGSGALMAMLIPIFADKMGIPYSGV